MYSINTFGISKLNNAEITTLFINVQKAIQKADAETLGLELAIMTKYATTLQKLIDQTYTSSVSQYTVAMQAADTKRDQVYKRIWLRLQMVEVCDDNDDLVACRDVVKTMLLNKYSGKVGSMPMNEETAVLQGFIMDLNDKLTSDDRDALGIESDLSALDTANAEFIAAYNGRIAEKAQTDQGVTVKLRSEMTDYYTQICNTVQYLANNGETANASKAAACQTFIGSLNVILSDAKTRYLRRTSGEAVDDETDDSEEAETPAEETPAQPEVDA